MLRVFVDSGSSIKENEKENDYYKRTLAFQNGFSNSTYESLNF